MTVLKDIKGVCMRIVSCPSLLRNFLETEAFFFFSGIDLHRIFLYCDMIQAFKPQNSEIQEYIASLRYVLLSKVPLAIKQALLL